MKSSLTYMDPFFGVGTIDLPEPQSIAATWFFIKAQTGNNHPGACAPFGMISACAYSGAYVTGYGLNAPNTHATPRQYRDKLLASGFTHLQQSGTGAIDTLEGRGSDRLALRETTLADLLGAEGYATGLFGKWHLGALDPRFHPTRRGFQEFAGFCGGWSDYYDWQGCQVDQNRL